MEYRGAQVEGIAGQGPERYLKVDEIGMVRNQVEGSSNWRVVL